MITSKKTESTITIFNGNVPIITLLKIEEIKSIAGVKGIESYKEISIPVFFIEVLRGTYPEEKFRFTDVADWENVLIEINKAFHSEYNELEGCVKTITVIHSIASDLPDDEPKKDDFTLREIKGDGFKIVE